MKIKFISTSNATIEQLELGFNAQPRVSRTIGTRPQNRIARANWWFAQMRQTVANAMDWNAVAQPRPEQIWIPGSTRQVNM